MFESLNDFFFSVYNSNKHFYGIQVLLIMSLIGINLGLVSQFFFKSLAEKQKG